MKRALEAIVVSDLHLGHRKTLTQEIIAHFQQQIPNGSYLDTVDVIWIPGDLFDRHLALPHEDVFEIHAFLCWLLRSCQKHQVALRILEGTPSHDWKQSRLIEAINQNEIEADVAYFDTLHVEHFIEQDAWVLYIPDEYDPDPNNTYNEVINRMRSLGIDQFDFAIMHGQFDFQLPPHVQAPKHDSQAYQKLVRHYIFIGHVHIPSQHGTIIAPGSFDRLAHGEEHPKGHWHIYVDPNGDDRIQFIENPHAKVFVTIDLHGLDIEQVWSYIDEQIAHLPVNSHVRFRAQKDDAVAQSMDVIKRKYSYFQCSHKLDGGQTQTLEAIQDLRARYQTQPITVDTIAGLVEDKVQQLTNDEDLQRAVMSELRSYTHGNG